MILSDVKSADLKPGTKLRYKDGVVVVLDRRKTPQDDHHGVPFHAGWWLVGPHGGLADFVIDNPERGWEVLL